jgi:hypothetical protein
MGDVANKDESINWRAVWRASTHVVTFVAGSALAALLMLLNSYARQQGFDTVKYLWHLLGDDHGQLIVVGTYILGIATYGLFKSTNELAKGTTESVKQQERLHRVEFGSRLELSTFIRPIEDATNRAISVQDADLGFWTLTLRHLTVANVGNGYAHHVWVYAYYLGSAALESFDNLEARTPPQRKENVVLEFSDGPIPQTIRELFDNLLLVVEWNTVYGDEPEKRAYAFRVAVAQPIPMPPDPYKFSKDNNPLFRKRPQEVPPQAQQ